jgi:hypothetical protein
MVVGEEKSGREMAVAEWAVYCKMVGIIVKHLDVDMSD